MFLHIPSNLAHDCPNSKALEAVLWSKVQLTALNSVSNSLVFVHLPIIRSKTSVSPHSPDRAFGAGNLLFNTVMESGDHGPFNSWDRQVGWPPFPPILPPYPTSRSTALYWSFKTECTLSSLSVKNCGRSHIHANVRTARTYSLGVYA